MPVLHLVVGPNGAGKTTFVERLLAPATGLPFVDADELARARWPGDEERHGHEAARIAARAREAAFREGRSFIAETVFSHPSKLELVADARARRYLVTVHAMLVPEELTVVRVRLRHAAGGHSVPEAKVRSRYRRLWGLLEQCVATADEAVVYDNTSAARPFREVARYERGQAIYEPRWPTWSPLR